MRLITLSQDQSLFEASCIERYGQRPLSSVEASYLINRSVG